MSPDTELASQKDSAGSPSFADWFLPTLAAGALRLLCLGRWSMWADEVATLRDAADLGKVAGYPVGYALIGVFTRLFGDSEFAARLAPAIAGIVTVPLLYFIGRRVVDRRAALWASWMLALSSYHLYYSQFARYYSLLVLFCLPASYLVYRGFVRTESRAIGASLALMALAFFTHWSAGLLAAAAALYGLWRYVRDDRVKLRHFMTLAGPLVLGGALLAPWMWHFLSGWGPWRFSLTAGSLACLKLVDRFDAVALLLAAYAAWSGLRDRRPVTQWLTCFAAVPVVLVVAMVAASRGGTRFALCALLPCLLLAGDGLSKLSQSSRRAGTVAAILLLVSLVGKTTLYFTLEHGQRPRWREAVQYVKRNRNGEKIVATSPPIVRYYTGGKAVDLTSLRNPAFAQNLLAEASAGLWLIVEHTRNVAPPPRQWRWIERNGVATKQYPNRVRVLDYGITLYRVPPRRASPEE